MLLLRCVLLILVSSEFALGQTPSERILTDCNSSKASVIFYRKFNILGYGLVFNLYHNDSLLTNIRTNSFFVRQFPIGQIKFTSILNTFDFLPKNKSGLQMNLQEGKIYFVRCKAKPFPKGIIKPGYRLLFKILNEKEVEKRIK